MRQSVRTWVLLHAICLSAAGAWGIAGQVGCSSAPTEPSNDPGAGTTADSASIGMELTLPNGEQVNSLNWTVTGPNGAPTVVKTGTVSVGDSSTVQFVISGMPAGSNYVILLSGTSVDGLAVCAGTATFAVPSTLMVHITAALQCASTNPDAASALVTASTFNCGTVTAVWVSPVEVLAGSTLAVSASAAGPNPGALTYKWSAPSGSFDTPASPTANYTCATSVSMVVPLTVTVSDGTIPDGGACSGASSTVLVTCDNPDM